MASGMNSKTFRAYLKALKKPGNTILLRADHAKGKSAMVEQFALELDLYWIDIRLGQRDLGDILGMPVVYGADEDLLKKRFVHILPELTRPAFTQDLTELGLTGDEGDILAEKRFKTGRAYQGICLFFDEFNRGSKDVQQACFEIVLDRRMAGRKLNPMCYVFAAVNSNLDVYTVTEMDPALISRFSVVDLDPTVDEWLKWGKDTGELCDEIIQVITTQKILADPPKTKDGTYDLTVLSNPHANRRSWHMWSKFYVENKQALDATALREIAATFIGANQAVIFEQMAQKVSQLNQTRATTSTTTDDVTEVFVKNFFRFNQWTKEIATVELKKMNAEQLQALGDKVVQHFQKYSFLTRPNKIHISEFEEIVPKEIFAKIWIGLRDDTRTKLMTDNNKYSKYSKV